MGRRYDVLKRLLAAVSLVASILIVGVAVGALLALLFAWVVGLEPSVGVSNGKALWR